MANTTNFGWETPDDTDLVKDGAAAIRTLGSAIDTSLVDLKGGTTGQVLSKATGTDMDFTWVTSDDANAIQNAIVDAKGDIVAASAADTPARLAVGTDNQRLVAASGEATGLKYVSDTQNTVIDAEGDLLVGDAADALQRLAIGSNAQVLTVDTTVDGKIKWATPAVGGKVLQVVSATTSTRVDIASTTYTDSGLTCNITPTSATSKILVLVSQNVYIYSTATYKQMSLRLMRDSSAIFNDVSTKDTTGGNVTGWAGGEVHHNIPISYLDSPATTSAITYKTQGAVSTTASSQDINETLVI
jgi:hypothetical protein